MVWQPGIRLFHSTDLATWTLVGHALVKGEHELRGLDFNAGIWAPSLTYDRAAGLFYVAYSVVRSTAAEIFDVDNFVVTATDITGPWSAPAYLSSVGFDPSFFHDDDGRHWVVDPGMGSAGRIPAPRGHRAGGIRRRATQGRRPGTTRLPRRQRPWLPGGPESVQEGTATTT